MTSKAQRNAGYLLPDQITGHDLVCLRARIPDTPEYRAAALGQMWGLGKWWIWEKTYQSGDRRASEAAEMFRELLNEYLEIGDCEELMSGIVDIRMRDCILEVQRDEGGEWEIIGDISECASCPCALTVDENGVVWVDLDGDGIPDEPYNPDPRLVGDTYPQPDSSSGPACLIAEGVVKTIQQFVTECSGAIAAGLTALELVTALLAIICLFTGNLPGAGALIGFAAGILTINQTTFDETFTAEFYDDLRCTVFLALNNNAEVTPDEWQFTLDAIAADFDGLQESLAWNVVNLLGPVGMQNGPATHQLTEANCACRDCPVLRTVTGQGYYWDGENWVEGRIPDDWRVVQVRSGTYLWDRLKLLISGEGGFCETDTNFTVKIEEAWLAGSGDTYLDFANAEGEEYRALSLDDAIGLTLCVNSITNSYPNDVLYVNLRVIAEDCENEREWVPGADCPQITTTSSKLAWWRDSMNFWRSQRIPDDWSEREVMGAGGATPKISFETGGQGCDPNINFEMHVVNAWREGGGTCNVDMWTAAGVKTTVSLLAMAGNTYTLRRLYANTTTIAHIVAQFRFPT